MIYIDERPYMLWLSSSDNPSVGYQKEQKPWFVNTGPHWVGEWQSHTKAIIFPVVYDKRDDLSMDFSDLEIRSCDIF